MSFFIHRCKLMFAQDANGVCIFCMRFRIFTRRTGAYDSGNR